MALWHVYYHLVWATRNREPLITPEREIILYPYLVSKADEIECIIHAIGGIADHVHLVATVPPKLAVADAVKRLKGSSAYYLNHDSGASAQVAFGWQGGYGVFTLGSRQLDQVVAYVQRQKQHHRDGTAISALEQTHQAERKGSASTARSATSVSRPPHPPGDSR